MQLLPMKGAMDFIFLRVQNNKGGTSLYLKAIKKISVLYLFKLFYGKMLSSTPEPPRSFCIVQIQDSESRRHPQNPTLSKIHPHWNWNSKLNTKLRLELQVEYRFELEFQVEWFIHWESVIPDPPFVTGMVFL